MKNNLILQFILFVNTFLGLQQAKTQQWIQQTPYPADVSLLGVHFTSATHGWIVGSDDLLMGTNDGGVTWTQSSSVNRSPQFSEDPIWAVQFVDDMHGWAWGNNGYRTTNGGQTWQQLPGVGSVYSIQFLDPQNGYLITNLAVYRTSDGGQTVTIVWDWQNFNFVNDATFISPTEGLLASEEDDVSGVFRTVDSGNSWQRISDQVLGKILYVTPEIVVGSLNGKFYRSTDGGENWNLVLDDSTGGVFNNAIERMTLIDSDSVAAIDINARIWISDDAGQSWTRTQDVFGNWGFGWDIQFPTPQIGFVVGRFGLVLRTDDGGQTWTQISNGAATPLRDIVMHPGGTGIAVGDGGVLLRTTDFGQQWNLLPQFENGGIAGALNVVQAIDADTFVVGGTKFYRSDDGGQTWVQGGDLPATINSLSFLNDNEGWACGPNPSSGFYIAKTTDGGQTWTTLQSAFNTSVATKIQIMLSGQGYSIFPQSEQALTDDGFEQSFIPRQMPNGESWESFEFGSDNVGWYGGFFGTVLRSDNGGFIFQPETLPGWVFSGGGSGHRLRDVRALSETEAYITSFRPGAIYQGVIYQRGESGWADLQPISVSTNQFAGAIQTTDVLPTGEIWTTGGDGFIFSSGIPDNLLLGDINRDGVINLLDVAPFVDLITNGEFQQEADMNQDGVVSLLDVAEFVELLTGN